MAVKYEAAVIGAGPAGYKAALLLASRKKKVCLIERSRESVGGTCLNTGCIPVKSFVEAARLYKKMKSSSMYGLGCMPEPAAMADIASVAAANIGELKKGLLYLLKRSGVDIIYGEAAFKSERKVEIRGAETIEPESIIIASGSRPFDISSLPVDGKKIINSNHLLDIKKLPSSLLIAGGGYVGCEIACAFSALGVKVTLSEMRGNILPEEDRDTASALERGMKKRGIDILTSKPLESASSVAGGVRVKFAGSGREKRIFDMVLSATGRKASYESLQLEKAGVKTARGKIKVNEKMETSSPGIYAAGDVCGKMMLAHTAYRQGLIASSSACGIRSEPLELGLVPRVVFSSPETAAAGLTARQASERGREIFKKKLYFRANAKALIRKDSDGFIKIICEKKNKKVLGVSIVGPSAGELIHLFIPVLAGKLSFKDLSQFIYAHPTLSEIINGFSSPF